MNPRAVASVVVGFVLAVGIGFWLASGEQEAADAAGSVAPSEVVAKAPLPAPTERLRDLPLGGALLEQDALQGLFPSQSIARCGAPEDLGSGRYGMQNATVLIRDGETWVLGDAGGEGPVRALGRWAGYLTWEGSECSWDAPEFVTVRGQVEPAGAYRVAGCPVGEVVETDASGAFSVVVPLGQKCAARAVHLEGETTAMGRPVQVSAVSDLEIRLRPPEALPEQGEILAMLRPMTEKRLVEERAELEALRELDDRHATAEWLIAIAEERVAFFEAEVRAFDDPGQASRIVEDFILSQSN
ncbi:MAG: hypothetical protein KC912_15685 [Proteobacteria bacterium]|nr:hypothetical protein [Pseudomonadota bacterium]